MKRKLKKIIMAISLLVLPIVLAGCSSTEVTDKQSYKDDKYNFSLNYPSNWQFVNFSKNKFFVKKPLTQKDVEAGKVSDKDCLLSFNALDNSAGKSLTDFWDVVKTNKETIRLGSNSFIKMLSPDNKSVTYSVADAKKQIFVFDGSSSENCKSDDESILSSLAFN